MSRALYPETVKDSKLDKNNWSQTTRTQLGRLRLWDLLDKGTAYPGHSLKIEDIYTYIVVVCFKQS